MSFLIPDLSAQAVEDEEEEVFELSPFTVETRNDGYLQTMSNSATLISRPIFEVPYSLEIITSEFIEDTGANDFKETLNYSAGVFTQTYIDTSGAGPASQDRSASSSSRVGDERTNAIVIRGYNAPFQERMGFRVGSYIGIKGASSGIGSSGQDGVTLGSLIDTVNVDRAEVVRGPGALIYGLGVLSGIVNVIPKKPLPEQRVEIEFTTGSDDYKRGTFDATGPAIKDVLNYRLMGAWQENGDWTDFFKENRRYAALQFDWRPIKSLTVFLEGQYGNVRYDGHQGGAYIRDNPGEWQDPVYGKRFVNEFGENYRWGQEDFVGPFPAIWDPAEWPNIWTGTPPPESGPKIPPDPSRAEDLSPLYADTYGRYNDPAFRIQGPDTFYEREENSYLVDLNWTPLPGTLAFNAGGFYTEQDVNERTVQLWVINQAEGNVILRPNTFSYERIPDGYVFEVLNPLSNSDPDAQQSIYRGIGGYWVETPLDGKSEQLRISGVYNFQTPFPWSGEANHSIIFGRQDIKDTANVPVGSADRAFYLASEDKQAQLNVNEDGDPFFMKSFYDWSTPVRYNGEPMPRPADNYFDSTLWYTGHYVIYQGDFFDDRITIIGGWRNDRYQGKEERWERPLLEHVRTGTEDSYYNFDKAKKIDTFSIGASFRLTENLSTYVVRSEGVVPNVGQFDGNGDAIPPELSRSLELGLKFNYKKISGSVALYKIQRDNAIWNYENAPNAASWEGGKLQQLDSTRPATLYPQSVVAGAPINYGISLDYIRGLIGGNNEEAARWRDKLGLREHALFKGKYYAVTNSPRLENGQIVGNPTSPDNPTEKIIYYYQAGLIDPSAEPNLTKDVYSQPYIFINYEVTQPDSPNYDPELKALLDKAYADFRNGDYHPNLPPFYPTLNAISPSSEQDYLHNIVNLNASAGSGANVTFSEEARGVDLQLHYRPFEGLEFIANFSHVTREAISDFNLVPVTSALWPELEPFSTEYDAWALDFGWEAFEDPTDPTTLKDGIRGQSLYYGSENSGSIWGKYSFSEGPVEGLELGLGCVYQGPRQTHIPIGSSGADRNRYPTPETEEIIQINAAIIYRKKFEKFDLRLALNLYNLMDQHHLYTEARYPNVNYSDLVERRRTEAYIDPFSWRISCRLLF